MNKYIYYYKIANLIFKIEMPFEVRQEEPYSNYLIEYEGREQEKIISVKFVVDDNLKYEGLQLVYEGNILVYRQDSSFYVGLMKGNGTPISLLEQKNKDNQKEYICHVLKDSEWEFHYVRQMMEAISLEYVFTLNSIHMLHASYIYYHGKSILFSAPSGTGKSTQAELWKRYEGAKIINGDRVAIRKNEKNWFTYGIPFCGSSGISENVTKPLGAIIVLKQWDENIIERIDKKKAFVHLYSEMIVHVWNREYQQRCIDWLLLLLDEIPVYMLKCRPNQEAVQVLKKQLEEDNLWMN